MPIPDLIRLLLLAAVWGGSFLFIRMTAPFIGAIPTAFMRVLLGFIGLAFIMLVTRTSWRCDGKARNAMIIGIFNTGVPFVMYAIAARSLPAGYLSILNATTPMMALLIGGFFFGEPVHRRQLAGVVVGLAGVAVLTTVGNTVHNLTSIIAVLLCLGATSCYGLAAQMIKRLITQRGGMNSTTLATVSTGGAILTILPALLADSLAHPPDLGAYTPGIWAALLPLGFLCTALSHVLYFKVIDSVGPVRGATVTFLIPPFAILWGALLLGEKVGLSHLAGGSLIAIALYLIMAVPRPAAQDAGRTAASGALSGTMSAAPAPARPDDIL